MGGQMTKAIPLTQGKVALIDDEDYALVSKNKWYALKCGKMWYAIRSEYRGKGLKKAIYMARVIITSGNLDEQCEHLNGDGLDNRRCNLGRRVRAQKKIKRVVRIKKRAEPKLRKVIQVKEVRIAPEPIVTLKKEIPDIEVATRVVAEIDDSAIKGRIKNGDFDGALFARVRSLTGYDEKFLMGLKSEGRRHGSVKRKSVTDEAKVESPELEIEAEAVNE